MGGQVGLCIGIFEDCSAFTHVTACTLAGSPKVIRYIEGFRHFVASMTAPIASGWSNIAGWDLHPLRNAAFARRTPKSDIHRLKAYVSVVAIVYAVACRSGVPRLTSRYYLLQSGNENCEQ